MRPQYNLANPVWEGSNGITPASGNPNVWRDWHHLTRLTNQDCECMALATSVLPTTNADPTQIQPVNAALQTSQSLAERLVYTSSQKTLTTVSILAHGISIYNNYAAEFFSDYQPYHYGGYNIITPEDEGALMINFNLYPGTYQPSGHINVSRAREFYFNYTSAYVSSANVADLLVLAIALNFLLISDIRALLSVTVIFQKYMLVGINKTLKLSLYNNVINSSDTSKLREVPDSFCYFLWQETDQRIRVNSPGHSKNVKDWLIRSEGSYNRINVQRLDGFGLFHNSLRYSPALIERIRVYRAVRSFATQRKRILNTNVYANECDTKYLYYSDIITFIFSKLNFDKSFY